MVYTCYVVIGWMDAKDFGWIKRARVKQEGEGKDV